MILTGNEIEKNVENGKIIISPFDKNKLNPNSYNFTLGDTLLVYENYVLDVKKKNPMRKIHIPPEGIILASGIVYLAHTIEIIGGNHYVPIIRGRSSIGRLGLFINITADLIHLGSQSNITMQLSAVQPVKVYPGMQIGQVTFWTPVGEITKYNGKYSKIKGPEESKIHLDFK